jgi:protein phosphatase/serine/threonine-protein phosphatase Stp1
MSFNFQSAAFTDTGLLRLQNEDAILQDDHQQLWAIADGMGGYQYGALASQMVIEAIDLSACDPLEEKIIHLKNQLLRINHHLSIEKTLGQHTMIGSTICLLLIHGFRATCLWAGDSRIYLLRDGVLHQLTNDHSIHGKLTQAVGMGHGFTPESFSFETQINDTYLLCSDGVYNHLEQHMLIQAMVMQNLQAGVGFLSAYILNQTPAADNLSIVMLRAADE